MSITDADRLANPPVSITLLNGQRVSLHYGFGGLRLIEKKFGSVKSMLDKLGEPMGESYYDAVFSAIQFGLWQTGLTEDELLTLIDPAEQEAYGPALNEALLQAFPKQVREMAEAAAAGEAPTASPGPTITTPQPSNSVEQMSSSGV